MLTSNAPSTARNKDRCMMSSRIEEALKGEAEWLSKRLTNPEEAAFRLGGYRPRTSPTEYVCPACWVLKGSRSYLDPVSAGKDDAMGCETCGAEFLV